eukprot:jgi/Ulvmu1/4783/UM020_0068.1
MNVRSVQPSISQLSRVSQCTSNHSAETQQVYATNRITQSVAMGSAWTRLRADGVPWATSANNPAGPELPSLPCAGEANAAPPGSMTGPTKSSNWLVMNKVLVGGNPTERTTQDTVETLQNIIDQGISTFICLLARDDLRKRAGEDAPRPDYADTADKILQSKRPGTSQAAITVLTLPIQDFSEAPDAEMSRFADRCCDLVRSGTKLYIHCQGGHGRTGTLACIMLGRLYGISAAEALRLCQLYHDSRGDPEGAHSPETQRQCDQVMRLLDAEQN